MQIDDFYEKIYIIHWKPLVERRKYLENAIKEFDLEEKIVWVDQYETDNDISHFKNPFNINKKLIAVNMSHVYCYEDQIKNNYKNILIIEDDIDLEYINLNMFLNQCAKEFIELDGDIAFLSTCHDLKVKNPKPPKLLYYDPLYTTRCTGAYIVNIKCTEKLLSASINFDAIDIVLNKILPHLNLRILWSAVSLKQGSETGRYKSAMLEIRNPDGTYNL